MKPKRIFHAPLAAKLGIGAGTTVHVIKPPSNYAELLEPLPIEVSVVTGSPREPARFLHLFVTEEKELQSQVISLVDVLLPTGIFWISWPKKTSQMETDLNEHSIRNACLALGLVDIKVCAIDADWTALKFVWRKALC